jgi:hypothetical protein
MQQQRLLGGALNRMRNFHLSRAWEQWQAALLPSSARAASVLLTLLPPLGSSGTLR